MLVDITPQYAGEALKDIPPQARLLWDKMTPEDRESLVPVRLRHGVWSQVGHFECLFTEEVVWPANLFPENGGRLGRRWASAYGVCDGIDNLLGDPYYSEILSGPRKFTVFLTEVRKEDCGAWRWHKWGPYIGRHEVRCEYLRDEEGIDSVWVFQIAEHVAE